MNQLLNVWPVRNGVAVVSDDGARNELGLADRDDRMTVLARIGGEYRVRLRDGVVGRVSVNDVSATKPPPGVSSRVNYARARMLERGFARFFDFTISFFVVLPSFVALLTWMTGGDVSQATAPETEDDGIWATAGLLTLAVSFVYRWLFDSFGGTIGKRRYGLQVVVDDTGRPPGLRKGFKRALVATLCGAPTLYIGYLPIVFDEHGKALHDHLTGTSVVVRSRMADQERVTLPPAFEDPIKFAR